MKRIAKCLLLFACLATVVFAVLGNPYAGNFVKFHAGLCTVVGLLLLVSPQGVDLGEDDSRPPRWLSRLADSSTIILFAAFGWGWCAAAWILALVAVSHNRDKLKKEGKLIEKAHERAVVIPPTTQRAGLTNEESKVLEHLSCAWNAFVDLDKYHRHEEAEMRTAINAAQMLVGARVAVRANPEVWCDTEQEAAAMRRPGGPIVVS